MSTHIYESAATFGEKLNPAQHRAATFGVADDTGFSARPLLIIAGAGTGKTNTLAHRVAHLLLNGVPPERILLLTFTRRAAQEMLRRAELITMQTLRAARPCRDRSRRRDATIVVRYLPLHRQPAAA